MYTLLRKYLKIEIICAFTGAVFLGYMLLLDPVIGRTDNGDFGRMMHIIGVIQLNTDYKEAFDGYVHLKYRVWLGFPFFLFVIWGFDWTSGVIAGKAAMLISMLFSRDGYFDIRFIGFIYIVIFATAVFFIVRYSGSRSGLFAGILLIAVFTDTGYSAYFNSFFGEAASLTFFLLLSGALFYLLAEKDFKWNRIVFFFLTLILFITSKQQNIPLLLLFCPLIFYIYKACREKKLKRTVLLFSILTVFISLLAYAFIGSSTERCNKYQTVFTGILKNSPAPAEDLAYLGIDGKFAVLAGSTYYTAHLPYNIFDPALDSRLFNNISRFRVLQYYITHPFRLYEKIKKASETAFIFYEINKSNFEKGKFNKTVKFHNNIRTWLSGKLPGVHRNLAIFVAFTFLYLAISAFYWIKTKDNQKRLYTGFFIIIGLCGAAQFILPVLGSGEADFSKHLFQLNMFYDTMMIISAVWIFSGVRISLQRLLSKKQRI